jgi:cell division transport system permease protein
MRPRTLFYCFTQGIKNLFKNRLMTMASITTIMASLFVVSIFYCILANLDFILEEFEHNIGIAVFFNEGVTENEILTLRNQLELKEEVFQVTYISEDAAWDTFKTEYFEGREDLLQGFNSDNPLTGSASLQVLFSDISKQEVLVEQLSKETIVRHVREAKEVTSIVQNVNSLVTYVSIALIFILSIISLFIIANTIRLAIALREREINIMRYIGARTLMINGPFIVEGVIIGLIGAAIPIIIIYLTYNSVIGSIVNQFIVLKDFLVFIPLEQLLNRLAPSILGAGGVLGYLGSQLTVSKYIHV